MIGLYNKDSSFFYVTSPDIDLDFQVLTDDIISFTVEEDQSRMTSGTIQINDPENYYSQVLKMGAKLDISWGYKAPDLAPESLFTNLENPKELRGTIERTALKAFISSPSGAGNDSGDIVYNINFYGREFFASTQTSKVYSAGTKSTVVFEVLGRLGVDLGYVNFNRGSEVITSNTAVRQYESDYRFLMRMSREWGAIFKIGTNPAGQAVGVFINPEYVDALTYQNFITGAFVGSEITLDYKEGARNVLSFTWQNHAGESGSGDNVRIQYINGKPVFQRYIASTDTVVTYKLNTEAIKKRLGRAPNAKQQFQLVKEWLKAKTFEEVKWAFTRTKSTTAPQGLGYSLKVQMIGNPVLMAPLKVVPRRGFPSHLASSTLKFYCRRVSHNIDPKGYFCELDIADTWTTTGGSLI